MAKAKKTDSTAAMPVQSNDDWQRDNDVRTLMEHAKLKADPKRHAAAIDHFNRISAHVESSNKRSAAVKKLAGSRVRAKKEPL